MLPHEALLTSGLVIAGIWERVFRALSGDPDFEYVMTPLSSMPTSTQQVQRGEQETEALGCSKGRLPTKIHTAVDGFGKCQDKAEQIG